MNNYLKRKSINQDKNIVKIRISVLLMIFLFGFMYLCQVNKLSSKGYEFSSLENKISELEFENEKINVEMASCTSISNLKERLEDKKMVLINDIKYISILDNSIAQR